MPLMDLCPGGSPDMATVGLSEVEDGGLQVGVRAGGGAGGGAGGQTKEEIQ